MDELALKFNMHKANVDLLQDDSNAERLSQIYGCSKEKIADLLALYAAKNNENAKTLTCVEPLGLDQEIRVCFLGDSITSDRTSYFNILKAKFAHLPTLKFSDLSISGAKSSDLVTSFIPAFCNDSPQIVVLMIGTNDMRRTDDGENLLHTSLQEYRRNLSYLLKKFKDRGAEIIISTLPPFCQKRIQQNYPLWGILYRQEDRIAYNKTIREVAKEYNAILNEMSGTYNAYSAEDLLLIDGLHLNEVGQCLLAKNVFEILLKLLQKHQR